MSFDSRVDRSDIIRQVREQASRVYIQTIAANEREDRLLHRKLDALDLEHRAQYLKMKKWIHDAHKFSQERAKRREVSNVRNGDEFKDRMKSTTSGRPNRTLCAENAMQASVNAEKSQPESPSKSGTIIEERNNLAFPKIITQSKKGRTSVLLDDRVKYTASEVARLKTSFAGQKTPPMLRRGRKFLPHLEEANAQTALLPRKGKTKRRKQKAKQISENTTNNSTSLPKIELPTNDLS
eukprot:gene15141-16697_t